MSNLQIARDILERALDAQDHVLTDAAFRCVRALKRGFEPSALDWRMVKAFWQVIQDAE